MTTVTVDIHSHRGRFFEVLQETERTQTAVMTIEPGQDAGPEETRVGDQIVYVVDGESAPAGLLRLSEHASGTIRPA